MLNYILVGLLIVSGLFLVVAVLLQNGKSHGLSGAISGGAETFFGKERGSKIDKALGKLTTIVGIVFVIMVLAVYVIQPDAPKQDAGNDSSVSLPEYSYSVKADI
jgi:preprotein translocase subunit SecG